ncbi:MAG TPA: hypothetical protein VH589_23545 [Trebonia sp.]|jgi:hypothetical protein
MNDLAEDLDRALRDVVPGEPPVAEAIRRGKVIRVRRRGVVLASVVAVVAAATASPVLARYAAAPASEPAQHRHTPAPHHDPVVLAAPGPRATMGPGGMVTPDGVIAAGSIGARTWQAEMKIESGKPCFTATISGGGSAAATAADTCRALPPLGGEPAVIATFDSPATETALGQVSGDVAYFIVTFTDGQQLKLIPVTWHGTRYIAWVAPQAMTVSTVDAYLGGPYSTSGQHARVTPTVLPGQW